MMKPDVVESSAACCSEHLVAALKKKLQEFSAKGAHPGDVVQYFREEAPKAWRRILDDVMGELAQGTPCSTFWMRSS